MPVYVYRCPACHDQRQVFKPLALLNRPESCDHCGTLCERQVCAPAVRPDYAGYKCPVTGTWIEGRKAHAENLARTGCRILEPGEKEQNAQRRRRDDEQLESTIAESVMREVEALPTAARERLASEMDAGLTVAPTRQ